MIGVETIFDYAVTTTLGVLCLSFLVTIYRIVKGPTLPDRILGLDMLVLIAIGFIAVIGIKTGYALYVDVAIALGLVGFLATVAFARFVLSRGKTEDDILTEAREAASTARREAKLRARPSGGNPGSAPHPGAGQTGGETNP
ncbi:MAG: cation:proton antiporter [Hoeflea sp.]|uniref:cation:proton antiporter n=1 Tax=Hoeflea sp. TaxID=1940281 RepID=UPI001E08CDB3|nr:cation:proton antiporter [Hoeflea sp.]MBU4530192.1 cation:proton antiporter [Alphaproteobacteria bacterium]MBU4542523.1 cation:proton antiporter [Alphaproteobacteria bacterium]MBU4551204.1 cation:proton antiporter [Alphaproteobacteria bacterium]MBV1723027.1 cation:proton antiporter [Hoeflea sp.]MBV1760038.1 cation:proton antiporter [Hoeflea sp.]